MYERNQEQKMVQNPRNYILKINGYFYYIDAVKMKCRTTFLFALHHVNSCFRGYLLKSRLLYPINGLQSMTH